MLVPFARLVRKRAINHLGHARWNTGVTFADRHGFAIQDDFYLVPRTTVIARIGACEDMVTGGSHRPDIAHGLEIYEIDDLLTGHKRKGASIATGSRHPTETGLLKALCKAQIGQFRVPTTF